MQMSSFCQPPKKTYSHVLIKLSKFAKDWEMTINKTKMLVFNKGGRLKNINIKYNNSSIKCVQKYTFVLILVRSEEPLNTIVFYIVILITTNDNVYTTFHGYNVQMTFDPLLPIGNDNENFDWTLSSSLQNVTVSDIEVMANAFTRS